MLPATGQWDDFASFMVPRKPGGGGCVCVVYRNSSLDMPGRIAHIRALCQSAPGPGVLAYVDGDVAGWCSVAPKATYLALVNSRTIPHVQDEDAWSVVCFVVLPGFRRRGLMHHLLDGAVGHAQGMGATTLEGYPVDPGSERIDQTSGYVGTAQLFEAHGFTRVRQTAGRRIDLLASPVCAVARPPHWTIPTSYRVRLSAGAPCQARQHRLLRSTACPPGLPAAP